MSTTPDSTADTLAAYLSVPDLLTVHTLVTGPAATFERTFVPLPQHRHTCTAVIVRSVHGLVNVELVPAEQPPARRVPQGSGA